MPFRAGDGVDTLNPWSQGASPPDRLRRVGLSCEAWRSQTYARKIQLISNVMPGSSSFTVAAAVSDIDRYCASQTIVRTQPFYTRSFVPMVLPFRGGMAVLPAGQVVAGSETLGSALLGLALSVAIIGGASYFGAKAGVKAARRSR